MDLFHNPFPNFNGGLAKPPLKRGHDWLIAFPQTVVLITYVKETTLVILNWICHLDILWVLFSVRLHNCMIGTLCKDCPSAIQVPKHNGIMGLMAGFFLCKMISYFTISTRISDMNSNKHCCLCFMLRKHSTNISFMDISWWDAISLVILWSNTISPTTALLL